MRNIRPEARPPQGGEGRLSPRLRALSDCENRIRELQSVRPSRDSGDLQQRHTRVQTELDTALRTARACVAGGDFQQARPAFLCGLVNGFSKRRQPPIAADVDAIMACIASEVGQRAATGALARWSPKHLSLMANGLSKGRGAWVERGLTDLAQAVLALNPRQLTAQWSGNSQSLTMMANGLSKGQGACIRQALAHLAQALPDPVHLTPGCGWDSWQLAMMANGLSKSCGPTVQKALERLARAVRKWDLAGLRSWEPRHLAMMVNGLGKGEGDVILTALVQLAEALPEAEQLTEASGWHARDLAIMANGLSGSEAPAVKKALIRLALTVSQRHPGVQQGVDGTAPDHDDPMDWPRARETPSRRPWRTWPGHCLRHEQLTEASGWHAQSLAMTANGLARGEGPCVRQALTRLAQAVLMKRQLTASAGWSTQALAMLTNGTGQGRGGCYPGGSGSPGPDACRGQTPDSGRRMAHPASGQ